MKLIYVAGPFSSRDRAGVEANIARAVELGIEVAKLGALPVIPHANTSHPAFEAVQPYSLWLQATTELLRRCDAAIMTDDWQRSSGARLEFEDALRRKQPVLFTLDELREWLKPGTGW